MHIVLFYHSLISDWNHGNAHFLRGIATELLAHGHTVDIYEPRDGWSLQHLAAAHGVQAQHNFHRAFPHLQSHFYDLETLQLEPLLDKADLVIVHEWNDRQLIHAVGEHRRRHSHYRLLFHDTHHRSLSDSEGMASYCLAHYDGVLAFGRTVRECYIAKRWIKQAWVWHEAADTTIFKPHPDIERENDFVWIGNWGDDERTEQLHEFLIEPVKSLQLGADIYGVRYPDSALAALHDAGIRYQGWLPNYRVPQVFARHRFTVHVPRNFYVRALPGIPTIRVFEALACAIPLISSPWHDVERLFFPGKDFLVARNGEEMKQYMRFLLNEPDAAHEIAQHGLRTLLAGHTCAHRVDELLAICEELGVNVSRGRNGAESAKAATEPVAARAARRQVSKK